MLVFSVEIFDGGTLLACARVALLWFLVYEKSILLTNDAACRGGSLIRLGPGHLMVSGDFCLSLSYLGATVSVLEQKTILHAPVEQSAYSRLPRRNIAKALHFRLFGQGTNLASRRT